MCNKKQQIFFKTYCLCAAVMGGVYSVFIWRGREYFATSLLIAELPSNTGCQWRAMPACLDHRLTRLDLLIRSPDFETSSVSIGLNTNSDFPRNFNFKGARFYIVFFKNSVPRFILNRNRNCARDCFDFKGECTGVAFRSNCVLQRTA